MDEIGKHFFHNKYLSKVMVFCWIGIWMPCTETISKGKGNWTHRFGKFHCVLICKAYHTKLLTYINVYDDIVELWCIKLWVTSCCATWFNKDRPVEFQCSFVTFQEIVCELSILQQGNVRCDNCFLFHRCYHKIYLLRFPHFSVLH